MVDCAIICCFYEVWPSSALRTSLRNRIKHVWVWDAGSKSPQIHSSWGNPWQDNWSFLIFRWLGAYVSASFLLPRNAPSKLKLKYLQLTIFDLEVILFSADQRDLIVEDGILPEQPLILVIIVNWKLWDGSIFFHWERGGLRNLS